MNYEPGSHYIKHDGYVEIIRNLEFTYSKEWAESLVRSRHTYLRAEYTVNQLKKYLVSNPLILDYGCGCGVLVDLLNKKGYLAEGVDNSPALIEYCRSHMTGKFNLGTEQDSNRLYDVIILEEVIEHFSDPWNLVSSIRSLLVAGGILYIETPNVEYGSQCIRSSDHKTCFTASGLLRLLSDSKFEVLELSTKTFPLNVVLQQAGGVPQGEIVKSGLVIKLYPFIKWAINHLIYNPLLQLPCWVSDRRNKGYYLTVVARKV